MPRNRPPVLLAPVTPDALTARYLSGLPVADVLDGYDAAAYWSSTAYIGTEDEPGEGDGDPLDNYMSDHDTTPAPDLLATFRRDVVIFLLTCERDGLDLSECDAPQVGHDIWLTRNGHGVGFWDREPEVYGSAEVRDALDSVAAAMGECDLYVDTEANTVGVEYDALDYRPAGIHAPWPAADAAARTPAAPTADEEV